MTQGVGNPGNQAHIVPRLALESVCVFYEGVAIETLGEVLISEWPCVIMADTAYYTTGENPRVRY